MAQVYKVSVLNFPKTGEITNLRVKPSSKHLSTFKEEIFVRLPELKDKTMRISYKDDDGDSITILNEWDFDVFQDTMATKLSIEVVDEAKERLKRNTAQRYFTAIPVHVRPFDWRNSSYPKPYDPSKVEDHPFADLRRFHCSDCQILHLKPGHTYSCHCCGICNLCEDCAVFHAQHTLHDPLAATTSAYTRAKTSAEADSITKQAEKITATASKPTGTDRYVIDSVPEIVDCSDEVSDTDEETEVGDSDDESEVGDSDDESEVIDEDTDDQFEISDTDSSDDSVVPTRDWTFVETTDPEDFAVVPQIPQQQASSAMGPDHDKAESDTDSNDDSVVPTMVNKSSSPDWTFVEDTDAEEKSGNNNDSTHIYNGIESQPSPAAQNPSVVPQKRHPSSATGLDVTAFNHDIVRLNNTLKSVHDDIAGAFALIQSFYD